MSNNNSIEIERKFLISGFPKVDFDEVGIVKTIYLDIKCDSNGKITQEIRVRRWFESGKGYRPDAITIKSGGTLVRTEIESNLTDNSLFNECLKKLHCKPIVKDYRGLYNNGCLIEFKGRLRQESDAVFSRHAASRCFRSAARGFVFGT